MLERIELAYRGGGDAPRSSSGEADEPVAGSVIWMHGLGADGHDFEPIVPELDLPQGLLLRFVFPHAPHRAVTINNGFVMRAWYDIYSLDRLNQQDEDGIRESAAAIDALIDAEIERGVPPSKIVLAGFSQGGVLAYYAGLRRTQPLAGVVALSCYLPFAGGLACALPEGGPHAPPIFAAHGAQDPTIPVALGEAARDALAKRGYAVTWKRYAMGHSVCLEEARAVGSFIAGVIGPA
ncbi:MAG: dienelactone hydrolase family protein [Pseudomonadota bacterium]